MDEDLKWLWAAYNKGAFETVLPKDLERDAFVSQITSALSSLNDLQAIWKKDRMIGIVPILHRQFITEVYQEPDILWFSWATARNKIVGAAKLVLELRKKAPVFVYVPQEDNKFVTHLAKYGIMRRVGKLQQAKCELRLFESIRRAE